MIITLIAISLIIIAIAGFLILDKTYFSDIVDDIVCFITALSGVFGGVTICVCLLLIICSHFDVDYDIHKAQLERDSIIKQLEYIDAEYENVSKVEIIQKVYEWNQKSIWRKTWFRKPLDKLVLQQEIRRFFRIHRI